MKPLISQIKFKRPYRLLTTSLAIPVGLLFIFTSALAFGFTSGYFSYVTPTPSSVEQGKSVTISGIATGAYEQEIIDIFTGETCFTAYKVTNSYYSVDSKSYNLPFSLTQTQVGSPECSDYLQLYKYTFSFSINTSTLSPGSHTVYLRGSSGGQYFYAQTSFTVTLPGSITVNSKDAKTGQLVYSPCCWTITGPVTLSGEGTSVTYTNQPTGVYTLTPGPRPTGYQANPTISPAATQTLTAGGTIIFNILWQPIPPPTVSITADPSTIYLGQSSNLTWSSSGATSCTASGAWSGSKPTSGLEMVTPATSGTHTYTLTCTGEGGSTSKSTSIGVLSIPATTASFNVTASPTSVPAGQLVTISGSVSSGLEKEYKNCYMWTFVPGWGVLLYGDPGKVLSVSWSLNNTSYNKKTSVTLSYAGKSGWLEWDEDCPENDAYRAKEGTYNITQFNIDTTGLTSGTHTVYLRADGSPGGFGQLSFNVTAAGTIKVESNKVTDWKLRDGNTFYETNIQSKTYENQSPGDWTIEPKEITNYTLEVKCMCNGSPCAKCEKTSSWTSNLSPGGTLTFNLNYTEEEPTEPNNPPEARNPSVTQGDYCFASSPPIILSWQFFDPDPDDSQSAYQVQVDNNSDFISPEKDSGKVISSSNSYAPNGLSYATTYYWQVKVWDQKDASSVWAEGPSFTTPLHAYPKPDFKWSPEIPKVDKNVQFTDQSQAFGGAVISSWSWTFQDGDPATSSSQNPKVKFSSQGSKQVTLTVTDSDGYSCPITKTVTVERISFWEWWKEIIPF